MTDDKRKPDSLPPDDSRFAPPDKRKAARNEGEALEKIDVRPREPEERFPRVAPRQLPPELENSPNLYPERQPQPAEAAEPPRRQGTWLANTMTAVVLLLTIAIVGAFVWAVRNPYHPMNPLALPTPLPQIITATFLPPTETPILPTATFTRLPIDISAATPGPVTPGSRPDAEPTLGLPVVVTDPAGTPGATSADGTPTPLGGGEATTAGGRTLPFVQLDDVLYSENENERGCNWASIAGVVYDEAGVPAGGIGVRVTDLESGEPITVFTGSSSRYPDGFEYVLNNAPVSNAYMVQLVTAAGVPLSEEVMVITSERCNQNVLVINFEQVAGY
jgi:hypothetical protein